MPTAEFSIPMKTLTVRLPEALVSQIEAESRRRKLSKSDVVRERLTGARRSRRRRRQPALLDAIADLIGSVDSLPCDLSARTKKYLRSAGLVRTIEALNPPVLLTTDTDFRIYRRHGRQVIPCVLPR
jgi:Arc/MetJ-type ribon-helix-helix transcriptional regulator